MEITKLNVSDFKSLINKGFRIVDLRPSEEFALNFIPTSLHIPLNEDFEELTNQYLFPDQAIVLVFNEEDIEKVSSKLELYGFSNIGGMLKGGLNSWISSKNPIDVIISISAEELLLEINHGHIQVIDIRPKAAYDLKHLEESDNIPVLHLINDYEMIDKNSEMCIFCNNGESSMSLISYLKINGIHNVYHVEGGFNFLVASSLFRFETSPEIN